MNSPSSSSRETALVTDPVCTLGFELARELARNGHNLVLVAAIEPELIGIASRLQSEFGVNVRPVALDLRNEGSADELFALLTAAGVNIEILVNVDGNECITERFLPAMVARGRGRILDLDNATSAPRDEDLDAPETFIAQAEARATELNNTGVTFTLLRREGSSDLANVELAALQERGAPTPQEIAAAAYVALIKGEHFLVPAPASARSPEVVTGATETLHAPEPSLVMAAAAA